MYEDYRMQCTYCGKFIIPHSVPYGIAWLCVCRHWMVMFSIDRETAFFKTGNEESALRYIVKIGKMLE